MQPADSADTRIALLEQALRHIEDGMDDIKTQIRSLPTKAEIAQMVTQGQFDGLRARVDSLESKILDEGTSAFWAKVRTVGLTITAVAGAIAVLAAGVHMFKV